MIKDFDQLIKKVRSTKSPKVVALVAAEDTHSLEGVFQAENDGIVRPILIGDEKKIHRALQELDVAGDYEIYNAPDPSEAAFKGVELVREGKAELLMKGKIQTATLLKAVVNKEKGLSKGNLMSHFVIQEVPTYHKLLVTTDGGMIMYPDLLQKKVIIENTVEVLRNMGYVKPKIGILAAVEKVNSKMPETVDAHELKQMNLKGEIKNCIIEGPISYDLAMDKEAAMIKGYDSEVAGDVDVLIVPNITVGNVLGKSLVYSAKAKMAGCIIGAQCPIALTSRSSTAEEKYLSLALATVLI